MSKSKKSVHCIHSGERVKSSPGSIETKANWTFIIEIFCSVYGPLGVFKLLLFERKLIGMVRGRFACSLLSVVGRSFLLLRSFEGGEQRIKRIENIIL